MMAILGRPHLRSVSSARWCSNSLRACAGRQALIDLRYIIQLFSLFFRGQLPQLYSSSDADIARCAITVPHAGANTVPIIQPQGNRDWLFCVSHQLDVKPA